MPSKKKNPKYFIYLKSIVTVGAFIQCQIQPILQCMYVSFAIWV